MFAQQRQREILDLLRKKGSISTAELITTFGVSVETVRRDLLAMESENLLRRVHGGAISVEEMNRFDTLEERKRQNSIQKQELCRLAATFVRDGDVIGIDSGSTAIHLAAALQERRLKNLTVVTYSLDVLNLLRRDKGFTVLCSGGQLNAEERAFFGPLAINALEQIHIQKAFVCPSALSLRHGIHDHPSDLYVLQKRLLQASDEVFVLADSSKFERRELLKLDETRPVYTYITDSELHPAILAMYKEHGIRVFAGGRDEA